MKKFVFENLIKKIMIAVMFISLIASSCAVTKVFATSVTGKLSEEMTEIIILRKGAEVQDTQNISETQAPGETELNNNQQQETSVIMSLDGAGTSANPYKIRTVEDFADLKNDLTAYYSLEADIDLSSVASWNPIGTNTTPFSGNFNGNNHTISNLTINDSANYRGLFGYSSGEIKNLKLNNISVKGGSNYVGGLAGVSIGTISGCGIESGTVTGSNSSVGGLVGYTNSNISNSYSKANVTGSNYIGGLAGYATGNSNITKCYATGNVAGSANGVGGLIGQAYSQNLAGAMNINECYATGNVQGKSNIGGIIGLVYNFANSGTISSSITISNVFSTGDVKGNTYVASGIGYIYRGATGQGRNSDISISNIYAIGKVTATSTTGIGGLVGALYNTNSSNGTGNTEILNGYYSTSGTGMTTSAAGTGFSHADMKKQSTYSNWNFSTIWAIDANGDSTPYLRNLPKPGVVSESLENGSEECPYIIRTVEDLIAVKNDLTAHYIIEEDLDLAGIEWTPLGTNSNAAFTGYIDGKGHIISNLKLPTSTASYRGLFGYSTGTIANINLKNVSVYGGGSTGALAGYATNVVGCSVEGGVVSSSSSSVGGLCGTINGAISNCYASVKVSGTGNVGGLVGYVNNSSISDCYADGNVVSTGNNTGGLVGYFYKTNVYDEVVIENCYATGNVKGNNIAGGLIGYLYNYTNKGSGTSSIRIKNVFATGSVYANGNAGGAIGSIYQSNYYSGAEVVYMTIDNMYSTGRVNCTTNAGGLIGYKTAGGNANNNLFINRSYWATDNSTKATSAGGSEGGVTLDQMKEQSLFSDWDFNNVWSIDANHTSTPYLMNLKKPDSVISIALGDGSTDNPYIINSYEDFKKIKYNLNSNYILGENLNFTGANWESIGDSDFPFAGIFDGDNYTISNLTINKDTNYCGLFGYASGTVKNIKLIDVNIQGGSYTGGIAGVATNVLSCSVESGTVSGAGAVGGLVGSAQGTINNCYAKIDVTGTLNSVGGLIGAQTQGTISKCYATGNVVTAGDYAGGFIGAISTGNLIDTIEQCYATGNVEGKTGVGGFVGRVQKITSASSGTNAPAGELYIKNVFATGTVKGYNELGAGIGSIQIGRNKTYYYRACYLSIQNIYATGYISRKEETIDIVIPGADEEEEEVIYIGGLIGRVQNGLSENNTLIYNAGSYNISNSYWTPETTKQDMTAGNKKNGDKNGIDKNTIANMAFETGYVDWDFDEIWRVDSDNKSIAYLRGLPKPTSVIVNNFTNAVQYSGGQGTEYDPFIITTPEQLQSLDNNSLQVYYQLGANINLINTTEWLPIGNYLLFNGVLNGNENVIRNLKIEDENGEDLGLFRYNNGTLIDVEVDSFKITGKNNIGSLVAVNTGKLTECTTKNATLIGNENVGGLVGVASGNAGEISNCEARTGLINVDEITVDEETIGGCNAGGLVGKNAGNKISQCISDYQVIGTECLGGIVGKQETGTVEDCTTRATIYGYGNKVGGIVGYLAAGTVDSCGLINTIATGYEEVGGIVGYSKGSVINSGAMVGTITGQFEVGGLVGQNDGIITDGAAGVTVNGINYVGGLVGTSNGTITGSSATGTIQGMGNYIGGLVGKLNGNITTSNSDISITGRGNYIGGLVGEASGSISTSYATGDISTSGNCVGGLVGRAFLENEAKTFAIEKCYATGAVSGNYDVGGLIGDVHNYIDENSNGNITSEIRVYNSFATGDVTGIGVVGAGIGEVMKTGDNNYKLSNVRISNIYAIGEVNGQTNVGGLIGYYNNKSNGIYVVTNSYWTPETTKQDWSDGNVDNGVHKNNIDYMTKQVAYINWDFNNVWNIEPNQSSIAYLKDLPRPDSVLVDNIDDIIHFDSGEGTEFEPYIIKTVDQLKALNNNTLHVYYRLGADIDLSGLDWSPIGNYIGFNGQLNGKLNDNQYSISNVTVNKEEDNVGLIKVNGGELYNIELSNVNVTGRNTVGGLVGYNTGEIINVNIENDTVSGNGNVGGLVGECSGTKSKVTNSEITNCTVTSTALTVDEQTYGANAGGLIGKMSAGSLAEANVEATVTGTDNVGGLVGYSQGTINSSYIETGSVTGTNAVGGLVGRSESMTANCHSTVNVIGEYEVGGLIGNNQGTVQYSYSTGNVQGDMFVGGFLGKIDILEKEVTCIIEQCYSTGNVQGNYKIAGFIGEVSNRWTTVNSAEKTSTVTIKDVFETGKVTGGEFASAGIASIVRDGTAYYDGRYSHYKNSYINISNMYAIGEVTGASNLAGLICNVAQSSAGRYTATNTYWTPETTLQEYSQGCVDNKGVDKNNIVNMTKLTGYVNWNFNTVWQLDGDGKSIAYLRILPKPDSVNVNTMEHVIPYDEGNGIKTDPYIITTADQLQGLNNNTMNVYYKLGADIDLSGRNWKPIGNYIGFNGELDGDEYTVSNLTINKENKTNLGLFNVNNGKLYNIKLNNINITAKQTAGALVAYNAGQIEQCSAQNVNIVGHQNIGGLVGETCGNTAQIMSCETKNGTVTATDLEIDEETTIKNNAGGLIGYLEYSEVIACDSNLTVNGTGCVGGLIGFVKNGNIHDIEMENVNVTGSENVGGCIGSISSSSTITNVNVNNGTVEGEIYVGGLAGISSGTVANSSSAANVNGVNNVGGLIGYSTYNISQSFATGNVYASEKNVGGLCGIIIGTVSNAYATGDVAGNEHVGGLIGRICLEEQYTTVAVNGTYATGNVTGENSVGGLIGELYEKIEVENLTNKVSTINIYNSFATGKVTGTDNIAGAIGYIYRKGGNGYASCNVNIYYIYAIGKVEGTSNVGGLIGFLNESGGGAYRVNVTYWTPETVKQDTSAGNYNNQVNKNHIVNMTRKTGYGSGWNFTSIWAIDEDGTSIAYLKALPKPDSVCFENMSGVIEFEDGDGTKANPFIIKTKEQFNSLNNNTTQIYYKLDENLDFTGDDYRPIGNYIGFNSELDGNGKVIRNLTINKQDENVGLFKINNSKIYNLTFNNIKVTGQTNVGAIAGLNNGEISDCNLTNITVTGNENVGGIAGKCDTTAWKIANCELTKGNIKGEQFTNNDVTLSGSNVGGLIGATTSVNTANIAVSNCKYNGTVNGVDNVGGLVGVNSRYMDQSTCEDVTVSGNDNIGGLIGYNYSQYGVDVSNSNVNNGTVTGNDNIGGLIGRNSRNVLNCNTNAKVTGANNIGGLIGKSDIASISDSYATGDVQATGNNAGGLIGLSASTILKVYSTGNVDATGDNAGGLIGTIKILNTATTVSVGQAYSTGNVKGNDCVGGIIGSIDNVVDEAGSSSKACSVYVQNVFETGFVQGNSDVAAGIGKVIKKANTYKTCNVNINFIYAIGRVNGQENCGGLVGSHDFLGSGTYKILKSYWTPETTNQDESAGTTLETIGERNTIEYMTMQEAYDTWNFTTIWQIDEDGTSIAYLQALPKPDGVVVDVIQNYDKYDEGMGTKDNPFIVKTIDQLTCMKNNLRVHYKLGNDINLSGNNWKPLGTEAVPFTGSLDGNGKKISNLTVNSEENYAGLFGNVVGDIFNLKMENANITGKNYSGIVVGKIKGNITDIEVSGSVNGEEFTGGIAGSIDSTTLVNGKSTANVEGTKNVGGIAGNIERSTLEKVTSSGEVEGTDNVGGLIGTATTVKVNILKSNGEVSGIQNVGGIIGKAATTTISNVYSTEEIQGNNCVGGIVGFAYAGTTIKNAYVTGDITGVQNDTETSKIIGGIAGSIGGGSLENCVYGEETEIDETTSIIAGVSNKPTVSGDTIVGGLVGKQISSRIINSHVNAIVNGTEDCVGGIAGEALNEAKISTSYVTGEVTGAGNNVGGMVGQVNSNSTDALGVTIEKSYSEADVQGVDNVGGLIGNVNFAIGYAVVVDNSFATSEVEGNEKVAGIIGNVEGGSGTLVMNNVYAIGKVTGNDFTGGLVGHNTTKTLNRKVKNSYWASDTTTQMKSLVGEKRNLDYMTTADIYTDWDFETIWQIDEDVSTPYLRAFEKPDSVNVQNKPNKVTFAGGKGLVDDPYLIATVEDLKNINLNQIASYKLKNDINCSSVNNWETLGDLTCPFEGTFDGDNREISNITIDSESDYVGLFGYNKGTIESFEASNFTVKGNNNVAAVIGYNEGTVRTISVDNSEVEGNNYVGAVIGQSKNNLSNMVSTNCTVNGNDYVGGLVGQNNGDLRIGCSTTVVNGNNYVGGIVGNQLSGTVEESYSKNDVTGTGRFIGGLLGYSTNSRIKSSFETGDVEGDNYVGGLVGNAVGQINIDKCYSMGDITATGDYVGGLAGIINVGGSSTILDSYTMSNVTGNNNVSAGIGCVSNSSASLYVENIYAAGKVTASGTSGGLVASYSSKSNVGEVEFVDSYWLSDATGEMDSAFGEKRNVKYLTYKKGYNAWNFDNVWDIDEGSSLAYLRNLDTVNSVSIQKIADVFEFDSGKGFEEDPYIIKTVEQFKGISYNPIASYKLESDLDLSGETDWQSICKETKHPYKGFLDGNKHYISNLTVSSPATFTGLFASNYGTINSLRISNFDINGNYIVVPENNGLISGMKIEDSNIHGTSDVGAFAGRNKGTIHGSHIDDTIVSGVNNVGGIVGYNTENGRLSYVEGDDSEVISKSKSVGGLAGTNTGTVEFSKYHSIVTGINDVGGLVGTNYQEGLIEESVSNATVTGTSANAGGIVGFASQKTTITKCSSQGTVIGRTNVGGVVGQLYSSAGSSTGCAGMNKCLSVGEVNGFSSVGGLVGFVNADSPSSYATPYIVISDSYSAGPVSGTNAVASAFGNCSLDASYKYLGVLKIRNVYAVGKVTGTGNNVGGFIGSALQRGSGEIEIINSYWSPELTEQTETAMNLGERRSVTELVKRSNYKDWNFIDVWEIRENETFPYFKHILIPTEEITLSQLNTVELYQGDGTEESPFKIKNADQLYGIRCSENRYYEIVADIDLSSYANWKPIGGKNYAFNGNLKGNNHTISNITIDSESDYTGIFGNNTGHIENINLNTSNVEGKKYTGTLIGYNSGDVSGITLRNGNVVGTEYVGGIIGYNAGTLDDLGTSYSEVAGDSKVGAIVGGNSGYTEDLQVGPQVKVTVNGEEDTSADADDAVGVEEEKTKPVAKFVLNKSVIPAITELEVTDSSFDPNEFELIEYRWKIKNPTGEVIFEGNNIEAVKNITEEYPTGNYTLGLVVVNDKNVESLEAIQGFKIQQILKPIADFEIKEERNYIYKELEISDKSSQPSVGYIVERLWTVLNEDGEVVHEGNTPLTDYKDLGFGKYTMNLVVKNNHGLESDVCTKEFYIIDDEIPPVVTVDKEQYDGDMPVDVKITCRDTGSGVFMHYYALAEENETPNWEDNIFEATSTVKINKRGKELYLHVIAVDCKNNKSEDYVFGPYKVAYTNPVADFELSSKTASKYKNIIITDTSYDENDVPITEYNWTVKNSNGEVIYEGSVPYEEFSDLELGRYTVSLKVTDELGLESEECTKTIIVVDDITPPTITANYESLKSNKPIEVNINIEDAESGVAWYRYAIIRDDEVFQDWGSKIADEKLTVTLTEEEVRFYIQVEASDNSDNITERKIFGPYKICEEHNPIADFEIENSEISKYELLDITDYSYDPEGYNIVEHKWEILSDDGQFVRGSSAEDIIEAHNELDAGKYSMKLVVVNEEGFKSEPCIKEFTLIPDRTAPTITVTPNGLSAADDFDVTIECEDTESGFNSFRYAITYGDDEVSKWGEEITEATKTLTIHPNNQDLYINIIAKDNDGNVSEKYVAGPYRLIDGPVASFEFEKSIITKYDKLSILDNSYDPLGEEIVTYFWTVKNASGTVVYSGLSSQGNLNDLDYSNWELGDYTVTLKVTNESGLVSKESSKEFRIVNEQVPPRIIVDPESAESEDDIVVTIECIDEESGFDLFRYSISEDKDSFVDWHDGVKVNPLTITISPSEHNKYIMIYARDKAGNVSEAKLAGPYGVANGPVARFVLEKTQIRQDEHLVATDMSFDTNGEELVSRLWVIRDANYNEIYSGEELPEDYSSYPVGIYELALSVTNASEVTSKEFKREFEILNEQTPPVITVTPESAQSLEDIDVTVECSDEISGFKSFKYSITYGDADVKDWSESITENPKVITITPNNRNAYLNILAEDNAGNVSTLKTGPYSLRARPVARFEILNGEIERSEQLSVEDKSYDPNNEDLISYNWVVRNSQDSVMYSGEQVPTDFSNYDLGDYTLSLVVKNASNVESAEFRKSFRVVEDRDRIPPSISVSPQTLMSYEDININVSVTDNESGFAWYKYALIDTQDTPVHWSDEMANSTDTITMTELNKNLYLHIIAADNAGNITEDTVYGPYIIRKPFAMFSIENDSISKYRGITIKDVLYEEPEIYKDIKQVWTMKNANGDVVFTGAKPPIDYSCYEPGQYTMSLKVVYDDKVESDECVKQFELLPDITPPTVVVNESSIQQPGTRSLDISVFETESGFNHLKYAITYSKDPTTTWDETVTEPNKTVVLTEQGKELYIHVYAEDNDGNGSDEYIMGPYTIPEEEDPNKWKFGIKFVDESDSNIVIPGLEYKITDDLRYYGEHIETTNEKGIIFLPYELNKVDSLGTPYKLAYNSTYDCGYSILSSMSAELWLPSNQDDTVRDHIKLKAGGCTEVEINDETKEYVVVYKAKQKDQSNGSYKLKVVKADNFDPYLGIPDAELNIKVINTNGVKASKTEKTKTDGSIKFNKINGDGNIVIYIKETKAPTGYNILDKEIIVNLYRDKATGKIRWEGSDTLSEDNVLIDNKKNLITITVPNEMQQGYFNFVVNNTDGTNGLNGTFTIVPNDEDLFSKILSEENGLDDDDYIEEQLGENQYRANEYGRAYLNAVKMPEEEGIYSYRIIQVQAPEGYELNRNEYEVFIEFRKVNNVMRIVDVYLGENCEGIEIDREMLNNQHIQINYINEVQSQEDDEPELSSEVYLVDNEYIDRIYPNTTIYNFVRNLNYVGDITITDAKGNSVNVEDTEKYIGTSYTVTITKGTESIVRKAVVVGDINYDGKVELPDANMITRTVIRLNTLNDIQSRAADITGNGEINVADSSVVERFVIRLEAKLFKMINEQ